MTGPDTLILRNPRVDEALLGAIVAMWSAVTEAGGAVGFLRGSTEEEIRQVALAHLALVDAGSDDLVLALEDGRPVGLAFLGAAPHRLATHLGVVKRLQRHPGRRGSGLGARVLRGVEEAAVDRGLDLVRLTVRGGTGTERFYEAQGYRVDGRLPARLIVGDGALIEEVHMSKPLTRAAREAMGAALPVRRLSEDLPLPSYAHDGDAGLDLRAAADVLLEPGERAVVPTGIAVAVPQGCVGLVHPRSGLAARHGVGLVNAPGTIDEGYRGEVAVVLVNLDRHASVSLARGDRIAQLVVQRVERVRVTEVDQLPSSARGEGGFGSTGR